MLSFSAGSPLRSSPVSSDRRGRYSSSGGCAGATRLAAAGDGLAGVIAGAVEVVSAMPAFAGVSPDSRLGTLVLADAASDPRVADPVLAGVGGDVPCGAVATFRAPGARDAS